MKSNHPSKMCHNKKYNPKSITLYNLHIYIMFFFLRQQNALLSTPHTAIRIKPIMMCIYCHFELELDFGVMYCFNFFCCCLHRRWLFDLMSVCFGRALWFWGESAHIYILHAAWSPISLLWLNYVHLMGRKCICISVWRSIE